MKSTADRYVKEILERVVAPASHVTRLREDFEGHFREAAEKGEAEAEVIRRMGTPEEVAASFMAEVDLRFAGFWERLFAFVGDMGLCFAMLLPLGVLCVVLGPAFESESQVVAVASIALIALLVVSVLGVFLLYFPVLEHVYGKTFGKHVLKLRVIREDAGPLSLGTALVRRIPFFFELLWLDALFIPFTEKKQRAFDIVAKTLVVREPDGERGIGSWLVCLAPWILIAVVAAATAILASS